MTTTNYDEACRAYFEALDDGWCSPMQPNRSMSTRGRNGLWTLRCVRGFLAHVTSRGTVLDSRFAPVSDNH
jgi:hypothetical protein